MSTSRREGFTLIEVLVSITILAVGIIALGTLMVRSSKAADVASKASYRTAIMAKRVSYYDALPFDQLVAGTACTTSSTAPLPYQQCTTITTISAKVMQVKIKITPTGVTSVPADSIMFERSKSGFGNPLSTP
jgi:prepilin-type N-terminal cleavage/methylation domain-containing protein